MKLNVFSHRNVSTDLKLMLIRSNAPISASKNIATWAGMHIFFKIWMIPLSTAWKKKRFICFSRHAPNDYEINIFRLWISSLLFQTRSAISRVIFHELDWTTQRNWICSSNSEGRGPAKNKYPYTEILEHNRYRRLTFTAVLSGEKWPFIAVWWNSYYRRFFSAVE